MYANVPSHTCSFQLPLRNGAKAQSAATSNNMSNGKIVQVLCRIRKKKEKEEKKRIYQERVGREREERQGGESKRERGA